MILLPIRSGERFLACLELGQYVSSKLLGPIGHPAAFPSIYETAETAVEDLGKR
jgi:hypothetical protein